MSLKSVSQNSLGYETHSYQSLPCIFHMVRFHQELNEAFRQSP